MLYKLLIVKEKRMRATHVIAALRALALILAGLALSSCGDEAGGGGACGGVDNNGVCLFISSIEPFDTNGNTIDVDVQQNVCDPVPVPPVIEPFSDHDALVTFGAFTIGNAPTTTTRIFIVSYTISYGINLGSGPGPILPSVTIGTGSIIEVPTNGSVQATVTIFNQQQKAAFAADPAFVGGEPSYFARYTFNGEDEFGNTVFTQASTQILLADFNNC
ncbi:MAG: hypothetical protein ACE10E_08795 [Acidiferrobacterales bacterium]